MKFEKYIPRYQELCKQYYGEEVSRQETLDGVIKLFNLAKAIAKPILKEEKGSV